MMKTTRTFSIAMLAGTMAVGMSACTQVEGSGDKASSATGAASSVASQATSAVASATTEAPNSSSQAPATSEASSSAAPTSSDPTTDSGSGDSASGPKIGKVGEEVKTSSMSAKVSKISDPIQSQSEYHKPDSGKHFVAVNITMTNLGSKDFNAGETCMKVKLDDNTSAKLDYGSDYGQDLAYGTLYKGDTTTGDVVYEVPNGHKIKTIDVKCGYGDEQAIRIQAK